MKIKDTIKEADLPTFLWWIFLLMILVIYPVISIYTGKLDYTVNGEIIAIDTPWWFYILGVVIWNLFLFIMLLAVLLIGLVFGKIGDWLYKQN